MKANINDTIQGIYGVTEALNIPEDAKQEDLLLLTITENILNFKDVVETREQTIGNRLIIIYHLTNAFKQLSWLAKGKNARRSNVSSYAAKEYECVQHIKQLKLQSTYIYFLRALTDIKFAAFPINSIGECMGKILVMAQILEIDLLQEINQYCQEEKKKHI